MSQPVSVVPNPCGRVNLLTMLASVLLGGLAAGAVWCLLSLATDYDTTFLIVPLAAGLGAFLRWQGLRGSQGTISTIAATLLAFVYAQYLLAAVRVAQMLGFPLRSVLFKMDFALGWQVSSRKSRRLGFWLARAGLPGCGVGDAAAIS